MQTASQDQAIDREEQQSESSSGPAQNEALSELSAVACAKSEQPSPYEQKSSVLAAKPPVAWRRAIGQFLWSISRRLATLAIFLVVVLVSIVVWDQYVIGPWTRDGRVRVQVASVAPRVSGQITQLALSARLPMTRRYRPAPRLRRFTPVA